MELLQVSLPSLLYDLAVMQTGHVVAAGLGVSL